MAIFLYEHWKNQGIPWRMIVIFVVSGMLVACFLAWRDEYRRAIASQGACALLEGEKRTLQSHLDALREGSRPDFRVTLDEAASGTFDDGKGTSIPCVQVIASIANRGAPSVAVSFHFTVRTPDGKSFSGEAVEFSHALPIKLPGGIVETAPGGDDLYERAQAMPIPQGGLVRGRAMYLVRGIPVDVIGSAGTVYGLEVTDIWGKKYSDFQRNDGRHDTPPLYPQIHRKLRGPLE